MKTDKPHRPTKRNVSAPRTEIAPIVDDVPWSMDMALTMVEDGE